MNLIYLKFSMFLGKIIRKITDGYFDQKWVFFIQVLEGEKNVVMGLYGCIIQDSRHKKAKILMTFEDSDRHFPEWQMGYIEGTENKITIEELIPLIHENVLKMPTTKARIISVLQKFDHYK